MDYIILNNDGSIANLPSLVNPKLKRYIQQGNNGVDKIFIGWPLGLSTDYGQAVFTLANQLTNTVLGEFKANYPYEADDPENPPSDYDGETCNGWVITLTSDQTIYNGGLFVSFRVIRNGIVQVAFPFTLMINETGVKPDTDSGVTIAQLDSYLLNIQNLITGAVRQNTDAAMSETSENPVQNKVVTQRINQAIAGVYKPGGTKTVAQLNALTKDASLNGYVYNVGDSGTLYDGLGGDIEVRTGDNVCLIYHDSENWYWDNMVGFIDTSLFVTKSGENILSGTYYIRGDNGLSFGREGATYHKYNIFNQEEGDSVDVVCYSLTDSEADPVVVASFTTEGFYAPVVRTQKLNNNNANYGLLLPDMSDWTGNKTAATTEVYDDFADEYRHDVTYALGELVIHENKLYKCTTAISTPEDWNSAHWTQTTIATELANSGKKYYRHVIKDNYDSRGCVVIVSTRSTAYDSSSLAKWLKDNGFTSGSNCYGWSGVKVMKINATQICYSKGIYSANGTTIYENLPRINITVGTGISSVDDYTQTISMNFSYTPIEI